ncbi:hypothetical protein ACFXO9_00555 [Nocardia tengchongensis]|uniref:hypothetical protein n=1 Tax=Nocardia tengchongensis TaxID=2055889 RepID=UPI0036BB6CC0
MSSQVTAEAIVAGWKSRLVTLVDNPEYVFVDTPQELIGQYRARLITFSGCHDAELVAVETRVGGRFPAVFRQWPWRSPPVAMAEPTRIRYDYPIGGWILSTPASYARSTSTVHTASAVRGFPILHFLVQVGPSRAVVQLSSRVSRMTARCGSVCRGSDTLPTQWLW